MRLVVNLVAAYLILWLLISTLGRHVTIPLTPVTWSAAVIILVVALYRNSVFWRKFHERQAARTATNLGGTPISSVPCYET